MSASPVGCTGVGILRSGEIEFEVTVPGSIHLTEHAETLSLSVAGCWSPATQIDAQAREVVVMVWPAGSVGGNLGRPGEPADFDSISVRWGIVGEATDLAELPHAGMTKCSLAVSDWSCPIPAGRWDLRVQAPGKAPAFFWDVAVKAQRHHDLGSLELDEGSRLSGMIMVEKGSVAGVELMLEPDFEVRGEKGRRRFDLQTSTSWSNDAGAFLFSDLASGAYTLRVKGPPGLSSREIPGLDVVSSHPLHLKPILLTRKGWLEVEVSPEVDPRLLPWTVQLSIQDTRGSTSRPLRKARTASGYFNFTDLDDGLYRVLVLDVEGQEMATQLVEIKAGRDSFAQFEFDFVAVEGRVSAGGEGVAGTLILTSPTANGAGGKLEFKTAEDGRFAGNLPLPGEWRGHFETRGQRLTVLEPIIVERQLSRPTRIDIVLPGGRIEGEVLDDERKAPERAIVTVLQGGRVLSQTRVGPEGTFRFLGLPPGKLSVVCDAADSRGAGPVSLEVKASELSKIELELEKWRRVRVRLVTEGRPASGASVVVHDPRFGGSQTLRAGLSGEVETLLPPGRQEIGIFVRAGRLPRTMRTVSFGNAVETVTVELGRTSGQLVIPLRRDTMSQTLSHAGATFRVGELFSPGFGSVVEEIDDATHSFRLLVESGEYELCRQAEERVCRSVYLAPNSQVELALPYLEKHENGK